MYHRVDICISVAQSLHGARSMMCNT